MWCLLQIYNTSRPIVDTILIPVIADVGGTFLIDKKCSGAPYTNRGSTTAATAEHGGQIIATAGLDLGDVSSQFSGALICMYIPRLV